VDNSAEARRLNAEARKRQRREESSSRRRSSVSSIDSHASDVPSSASTDLARVIQLGVNESNMILRETQTRTTQLAALQLLVQYGTVEEKVEALNKIRTIALAL